MKKIFACLSAVTAVLLYSNAIAQTKSAGLDAKIAAIIQKLTLEEKIALLHANGLFTSAGVKRLGIPDLYCDDGPLGVREETLPGWKLANLTTDSATFFPNGSALAATWDPELAYRFGHDMGEEARARKKNIMLAPAFNICRTPLNGRTYEYYSEDPYLNSKLVVPFVKGIQSQHVAACVKHYAVNNQEVDRGKIDVQIDERALREIYLPAFRASIMEGGAWTIMSAYNKIRGEYCSQNDYLLNKILKGEWGFKGFVMSDWGGTHSTVDAATKGLDVEMGSGEKCEDYFFADKLLRAVKEGKVSMKLIDEKVQRVLWVMYHTSLSSNAPAGSINTAAHSKTVYDIASESIVLLKNEKDLLPLKTASLKSIAVIGDNATHLFHWGGFGAGVKARYEITPLAALQNKLGSKITINYAKGYSGDYHPRGGLNVNTETQPASNDMIEEAVDAAKRSDLAILFIGGNRDYESEGRDRKDLSLPFGEQALVDAVTAANANTIVVVTGGAPYDIGAIKKNNHTIVWNWYNGSENGNALVDVLLGKTNPSGKLPFTFPASLDQSPAHSGGEESYPGTGGKVVYKEGILVGYRWFDTKVIEPLYPFGYGLSYTRFQYAGLGTNKKSYAPNESITVTVNLKNTGGYAGKETVQVYVSKKDSRVERAEKELKAFRKLMLNKGGAAQVRMTIPVKDLAYFDTAAMKWIVEPGEYTVSVGSSSRDIRGSVAISIQ